MKKTLVLVLVALLALGTLVTGSAGNTAILDTDPNTLALANELVELDIIVRGNIPDNEYGTKWFFDFCEKELNIKFNAEFIDSSVMTEKLNILMGTDSMPDMIMASATIWEGEVMDWGYQDGLFLAINEYEEYCPKYWAEIRKQPALVAATTTPDGNCYGFSNIRVVNEGQSMGIPTYINRQWLENLGLEMPNTLEDFYNVLCAFRDQDANGNGDPTDEIPWAGVNSGGYPEFMVVKWAYGINGYRTDAVDTWTLEGYWAPYHPRYKEALEFMKKLYDEGLLYDGYFSATHDQLRSDMQASTEYAVVGFSIDDGRGSCTGDRSLWPQYDACNPFVVDDTIVRSTWMGAPIDLFTWTISSKTEYPELCCAFCDFWYEPYWAFCYQNGPEYGTEYDYYGTGWVYDIETQRTSFPIAAEGAEKAGTDVRAIYNSIMDGANFGLECSTAEKYYFEGWTYGKGWDEEEARYQATVAANNYPYEMPQYIGGYWTEDQQEIYDTYASACSTFTRAQEAMLISGERAWDEYDAYIEELTAMGGDKMNELYKEYMEMVVEVNGLVSPAAAAAAAQ